MANKSAQFVSKSAWALLLAVAGAFSSTAQGASAQTANSQPFDNPLSPDRTDIFSNRGASQSSGMMDIIHRALQGQSRSSEDFNSEQRENLDDAASQFRAIQQQRLKNQPGTASSTQPANQPTPANQ